MAVHWSGLSPELLLHLDRGRGAEPLRSQLVLGVGNLTERTIAAGIAAVGDLLQGG